MRSLEMWKNCHIISKKLVTNTEHIHEHTLLYHESTNGINNYRLLWPQRLNGKMAPVQIDPLSIENEILGVYDSIQDNNIVW